MRQKLNHYHQLPVLILGLGISGRSAARFLLKRGAFVTAVDQRIDLLKSDSEIIELIKMGLLLVHESKTCDIKTFNLVVVSPGLPPSNFVYQQAIQAGIEVVGEVELAARSIKQKCLAITGTNGKTTVTLLVTHILNQSGLSARAFGNVGTPLTSAADELNPNLEEIFVLELSSFQLEAMKNPFIDVGVILNVTPDHLDRYQSLDDYAESKARLKGCLKGSGKLYIEDKTLKAFAALFDCPDIESYGYDNNCFIYTDKQRLFVGKNEAFILPSNLQGKSSHEVENLMAAYALCRYVGITDSQFCEAIKSFKKPSHRIEFIRTVSGVHYYDDSKGTNINAVIRAVESLNDNIILIAGGLDKGTPYTAWLSTIANKVKFICAIGMAKEKIKNELGHQIPVKLFLTLDEAVKYASKMSATGDTVLLSPGCASFDMFRDYAHRGQEFQRIVNGL